MSFLEYWLVCLYLVLILKPASCIVNAILPYFSLCYLGQQKKGEFLSQNFQKLQRKNEVG